MVDLIKLPIDPIEVAENTPFLAHYFPTIFVKGLIPLNPRRWLATCQRLSTRFKHLWAYKHIKPGGRVPFGFVTPLIFSRRSALGVAELLLSNRNYSIVKQIVTLYSYFRYTKFISKVARKFIPKIYKNFKNKAILIGQKLNQKLNRKNL